jgi:phosphoglucomutase
MRTDFPPLREGECNGICYKAIAQLIRPNGEWTAFTGDQLGVLFAARALDTYKSSGKPMSEDIFYGFYHFVINVPMFEDQLAMVASTVSSKMIEAMAQYEGFKFVDCLTGELCSADEII